jgi:hypothetical protein
VKQSILYFLLGIFITISIASTTNIITTIKPSIPKDVYIQEFSSYSELYNIIQQKNKERYIVKTTTMKYSGCIIMEKY